MEQRRDQTEFVWEPRVSKTIKKFGRSVVVEVLADIQRFEAEWKRSKKDEDLPPRYNFKAYKGVHQPYKLCQIYLGLSRPRPSYRAVLMFYKGVLKACWIHAFKKEADSEPQEVELAKARARGYWDTLEEGREK